MMTTLLKPSSNLSKNGKFHPCVGLSVLSVISCLTFTAPALGAIATFDDLPEGFSGTSITDGGITFSDLIAGFRSGPPQFVVATTDQLVPFFSPPNYLTTEDLINGFSPSFGAFGSARISTGNIASTASLDIFSSLAFEQGDNLVVLDALLNGNVVASTSTLLSQFTVFGSANDLLYKNFTISGVKFDELQLYTPIAFADGVINIGIDNVQIGGAVSVPEPTSALALLTLGIACSVGAAKQAGRPEQ